HVVDIETVRLVRGDTTRGRMGLPEVAHLLELGHDAPDRGRAKALADSAGNHSGTDWLAGGHKSGNRLPQDLSRALIQNQTTARLHKEPTEETERIQKILSYALSQSQTTTSTR